MVPAQIVTLPSLPRLPSGKLDLTDPAHCDTSLEQMARDYRHLIRQVQPQGPYHLLGWSLGGPLAVLVASLLEAEGQTVAFLGLVDSFIPGDNPPHQEDWRRDFADFVSVVIPGAALEEEFTESLGCASPSAQTVAGLLERAASTAPTAMDALPLAEGYAMLNSEDLARVFMVARHLQMLSRRLSRLPALQVSANCWWIKDRALAERRALVQQLVGHLTIR
jgi:thioesterase domain-containing protein